MDVKFVGAVALRLILVYYFAPEKTCGAYLGDLHEVGASHAYLQDDAASHMLHLATHIGQACHHLVGCCEAEAQFLHDVGAGVVEQATFYCQNTEFGEVLVGIFYQFFDHGQVAVDAAMEQSMLQGVGEEVERA